MRLYACNQCGFHQETPLAFEVVQRFDEEDDDDETVTATLDLCSAQCLSDFAMGLSLDFPEGADP